ncbi:adenosylcobinamide-phosphate synthase CbiB [Roseovarius dicentrarchi]|uniref:adenosylcobinamide-phosphate synthase CbiB n=1 Tax=Roseovarius dicentrarchi TaxID=2250573 RepID=UPI000DEABDFD|nr:adenosylcobinamide-phosphate synthase CbiB [Roseovarius dicentrarchi]
MSIAAIVTIAMALDALLGEPRWLWQKLPHPAVLMGRAIDALDSRWNIGTARRAKGVAAIALLGTAAIAIGVLLSQGGVIFSAVIAAILIAQRSLCDHVAAVASALRLSLPEGRAAVAMIVGRDTAQMDAPAVTRAAIESAAENFSDGVIAPLFWLGIGGLPGLILYKMVNTADSMIGHLTPRHAQFGWAAARLDDFMNLVPARISALLISALSRPRPVWSDIATEARQHRSPNAGWPEAAMARAIGVALSGPRAYHGKMQMHPFVNPNGSKNPRPLHIDAAVTVLWKAWSVVFSIALLFILFL